MVKKASGTDEAIIRRRESLHHLLYTAVGAGERSDEGAIAAFDGVIGWQKKKKKERRPDALRITDLNSRPCDVWWAFWVALFPQRLPSQRPLFPCNLTSRIINGERLSLIQ